MRRFVAAGFTASVERRSSRRIRLSEPQLLHRQTVDPRGRRRDQSSERRREMSARSSVRSRPSWSSSSSGGARRHSRRRHPPAARRRGRSTRPPAESEGPAAYSCAAGAAGRAALGDRRHQLLIAGSQTSGARPRIELDLAGGRSEELRRQDPELGLAPTRKQGTPAGTCNLVRARAEPLDDPVFEEWKLMTASALRAAASPVPQEVPPRATRARD